MKTIIFALSLILFFLPAVVFADHSEVTIMPTAGSASPGCEETEYGCYVPNVATVDVGGVVKMFNTDTAAHTFTAGTPEGGNTGEFDTGLLMASSSFDWSPDTVGEVPYYCMIHTWMTGLIVVQEAAAEDNGDEHSGNDVMLKGDATATDLLSDGTLVSIWVTPPTAGEMMTISIDFEDREHVNHDMFATQNGVEILRDIGSHHHDGTGVHTTAPLSSSNTVEISVVFQGYGIDQMTGPISEILFSDKAAADKAAADKAAADKAAADKAAADKAAADKAAADKAAADKAAADKAAADKAAAKRELDEKKSKIASFVDKSKDPQSYIDRYNKEPSYREWFHDNYPYYDSIEQAVGLELTEKIPDWVKNIFGWYATDQVSEVELLNAIKYLINEKILIVN